MPPVGFEPIISAGERPYTYALDRAATGTGNVLYTYCIFVGSNNIAYEVQNYTYKATTLWLA